MKNRLLKHMNTFILPLHICLAVFCLLINTYLQSFCIILQTQWIKGNLYLPAALCMEGISLSPYIRFQTQNIPFCTQFKPLVFHLQAVLSTTTFDAYGWLLFLHLLLLCRTMAVDLQSSLYYHGSLRSLVEGEGKQGFRIHVKDHPTSQKTTSKTLNTNMPFLDYNP